MIRAMSDEPNAEVAPGAPAPAGATPDAPPPSGVPALESPGPSGRVDPHPWAEANRPRGLDAPFAPGGGDDATPERIADERRMTRLLVLMVVLLVAVPTLLTLLALLGQLLAMRGG
jgi:hypothetical protein